MFFSSGIDFRRENAGNYKYIKHYFWLLIGVMHLSNSFFKNLYKLPYLLTVTVKINNYEHVYYM